MRTESPEPEPRLAIRARAICLTPPGATSPILDGIDLDLAVGEFLAIMGSSGAGKSTLLYCLSALARPSSGSIEMAGRRVDGLNEDQLTQVRREVGFVFQQINVLPHLTLLENVALVALQSPDRAARRSAFDRARDLLARVGLTDAVNRVPAETSGGQQQRAAIARALLSSPPVLFADEPTGALNSAAGSDVLDLFDEVHAGGQTIVMVTHDPRAAARAGRVVYLSDGQVRGDLRVGPGSVADREAELLTWLTSMGW